MDEWNDAQVMRKVAEAQAMLATPHEQLIDELHKQLKEQEGDDGIAHDMERLRLGLENCRLLAARHRKEYWALLILGFCAEAGVVGSITR